MELTVKVVEGELFRRKRENNSLKDQLQRALRELKGYQLKYPSAYVPPIDGDEALPPWTASPEITTPLFIAYDARKSRIIVMSVLIFHVDIRSESTPLSHYFVVTGNIRDQRA